MIPIRDDAPTLTVPYVTYAIIALNALVFVYQLMLGSPGVEGFIYRTAAIPYEITHWVDFLPKAYFPPPFTLVTAMFVHGGLFHIGGNMLFLWIFGDNIEDMLGHFWFLVFYLAAGIAASLTHIFIEPLSITPMVGASGAVAGVLGAYFLLFPRSQVLTLVFLVFYVTLIRIPAIFFLGVWFLMQVFGSTGAEGIAWFAHIGGFVAGALIIIAYKAVKGINRHRHRP